VRTILPRATSLGLVLAGLGAALADPSAAPRDRRAQPAEPLTVRRAEAESISYTVRVTDNNLVGLTLSNYGFLGNNFVSRSPSMEYPLGLGFEHMVRGGLWIGARALDDSGSFTGVVTAAVDGVEGASSQNATEYTPAGREIEVRSTLINNKFFNPNAVSELDFLCSYSDQPAKTSANNREPHRPISILVRQESYAWSFSHYQHLIILHFTIENLGPPLANVWVGLYAELASGAKLSYTNWPPGGSWYNRKWIQWDDSLRLFREHYCVGVNPPNDCQLHIAPYWAGMKLLTPPDSALGQKVTLAAWDWEPGSALRDEDTERYAIMSAGTIQDLTAPDLQPQSGDPVEVLAIGPFPQIDPGATISVDFALVGGAQVEDIREHARFAQRAFDRGYVVPVPPPSPRLHVVARNGALDLYWDESPESAPDPTSPTPDFEGYRVYVGEERLDLKRVAQFDLATAPNDTTGFNTGLQAVRLATPARFDGVDYHYRYTVPGLRTGFKYFVSVTSYDMGTVEIESLESGINQNKILAIPAPAPGERSDDRVTVFPNPYRVEARWDQGQKVRDHYLWFANLPKRCLLRIYTLAGDQVFETEFDGDAYHGEGARGIYDPRRELDVGPPTLSGATFGWNLISSEGQAVATGLYLFSVEDRDTGKRTVGKFVITKSDREEF
jgi:hypothetical protein